MEEKHHQPVDSSPPFDPSDAISQSMVGRARSRAQRLHRTLETMLEVTRSNPPATPAALDQLLGTILDALLIATEAPMGNLQLYDPASDSLRIRAHRGFKPAFLHFFDHVHDGAACGAAFASGQPEVVDDVATSTLYTPQSRQAMLDAYARAVQSIALITGRKKLGVVSVHYPAVGIPSHKREAFASAAPLITRLVEAGLRTL